MAGFDVPWTENLEFLFIFGQCVDNCKQNLFSERKVTVTERPRSLNPRKAVAMAISLFILLLSARARCMTWRVNLRAQMHSAVAMGANVFKRLSL